MPSMEAGDIIGHEPMGIVVETGSAVKKFKKGDRVVVPFVIAASTQWVPKHTAPVRSMPCWKKPSKPSGFQWTDHTRSAKPLWPVARAAPSQSRECILAR